MSPLDFTIIAGTEPVVTLPGFPVLSGFDSNAGISCLKRESSADADIVIGFGLDADEAFGRIRCPLCAWQPGESSRWCCTRVDAPEGFFGGCGTVWNTFSTRGRCPGCQHQWLWTKCLRCAGWSLHTAWYEDEKKKH